MLLSQCIDIALTATEPAPPGCRWGPWEVAYNDDVYITGITRRLFDFRGDVAIGVAISAYDLEECPVDRRVQMIREAQQAACTSIIHKTVEAALD